MSSTLKMVFFGSPESAVPALETLAENDRFRILAVVTQPDRPAGRGRRLTPPPVKTAAQRAGLEVWQPETIRGRAFRESIAALEPDYLVVVAYGQIFRPKLLATPRCGCVNLHFSLLPLYRGAAPVNWALIRGEKTTGLTTMLMDEGLDTGPILLQEEHPVEPDEKAPKLTGKLAAHGAGLMVLTLVGHAAGDITPLPQDDSRASYAPMLKKGDGLVDWRSSADEIYNRWRGLMPWPGIHSVFRSMNIKLTEVSVGPEFPHSPTPGLLVTDGERLFAHCGAGTIEILEVQLPGKSPIAAADFLRGYRLEPGERLG